MGRDWWSGLGCAGGRKLRRQLDGIGLGRHPGPCWDVRRRIGDSDHLRSRRDRGPARSPDHRRLRMDWAHVRASMCAHPLRPPRLCTPPRRARARLHILARGIHRLHDGPGAADGWRTSVRFGPRHHSGPSSAFGVNGRSSAAIAQSSRRSGVPLLCPGHRSTRQERPAPADRSVRSSHCPTVRSPSGLPASGEPDEWNHPGGSIAPALGCVRA